VIKQRKVKNQRLAAADCTWTFAALTASPEARAHYDRLRARGDGHPAACAPCSIASSVNFITAWKAASTTTRNRHLLPRYPPQPPNHGTIVDDQLVSVRPSGVCG
jgi:hypothetical protein